MLEVLLYVSGSGVPAGTVIGAASVRLTCAGVPAARVSWPPDNEASSPISTDPGAEMVSVPPPLTPSAWIVPSRVSVAAGLLVWLPIASPATRVTSPPLPATVLPLMRSPPPEETSMTAPLPTVTSCELSSMTSPPFT